MTDRDWESLAKNLLTTISWAMMSLDPKLVLAVGVRCDLREFDASGPWISEDEAEEAWRELESEQAAREDDARLSRYLRGLS